MRNKYFPFLIVILLLLSFKNIEAQSLLMTEDDKDGFLVMAGIGGASGGATVSVFGIGISNARKADIRIMGGSTNPGTSEGLSGSFVGVEVSFFPGREWEGEFLTAETIFGFTRSTFNNSESIFNNGNSTAKSFMLATSISKNMLQGKGVFRPGIGAGMSISKTDQTIYSSPFLNAQVSMGRVIYVAPSYSFSITDNYHQWGLSAGLLL